MDPKLRARSIVEIAKRGDWEVLQMFAHDMILNANGMERERILGIVAEEATHYSKEREALVPAEVVGVFANAVRSKVEENEHVGI